MNPIRRAWEWLYPPADPTLRNKPGGMAWIKGLPSSTGESDLTNRAVKTVRVKANGLWEIEPNQAYTARVNLLDRFNDTIFLAGQTVIACAIPDAYLEPWKEDGITESEVSALYQPSPEFADQVHLAVGVTSAMCGSTGRTAS